MKHAHAIVFITAAWLLPVFEAAPSERDEEFVAGLLRRGYYDLLEVQYRDWLSDTSLSEEEQLSKKLGLARLYAYRARLSSETGERKKYWSMALEAFDQISKETQSPVSSVRIKLEKAKVMMDQARLIAAGGWSAEASEAGKRTYRETITLLEDILKETVELLEELPGYDTSARDALVPIAVEVEYRLAWAKYELASIMAESDRERRTLLTKALETFRGLSSGYSNSDLALDCYLGEAMCLQTLGRHEDALKAFKQAVSKTSSLELVRKALYNQAVSQFELRKYLDAIGSLNQALKWSKSGPEDDLYYGCMLLKAKAIYAMMARASEAERAQLLSSVKELVSTLQAAGGKWREAVREMVLDQAQEEEKPGYAELAEATGRMRTADYAAALPVLKALAAGPHVRNDPALRREVNFKLAVCFYNLRHYGEAGELFMKIFQEEPDKERAQHAGYYAAASLGLKYDETRNEVDRQVYVKCLENTLAKFPLHPQADDLYFRLGGMYETEKKYPEAVREYDRVGRAAEQYDEAVVRAAICCERELRRVWEEGAEDRKLQQEAVKRLSSAIGLARERRMKDASGRPRLGLLLALTLAKVYLRIGEFDKAIELLNDFKDESAQHADLGIHADLLLLSAFSKSGDLGNAVAVAGRILKRDKLTGGEISPLLALAAQLEATTKEKQGEESKRACRKAIELYDALSQRHELSRGEYIQVVLRLAELYPLIGEWQKGAQAYETLKKKFPDARNVQIGLALSYEGSKNYAEALKVWRGIERKEPSGTPFWWEAKYHIVLMHSKLGHNDEVIRIIDLLRTLRPTMGGEDLKGKFQKLEYEARTAGK